MRQGGLNPKPIAIMKTFLVTLLILGAAFVGYDRFLALPEQRVLFAKPAVKPAPASEAADAPKPKAEPPPTTVTVTEPKVKPSSVPQVPETPKPEPVPTTAAAEAKPAFQPPHFDTIEMLTKGWTQLPKSAFPRAVKLMKEVTFKFSVGLSTMKAGAEVVALSLENGQLIIAPSEAAKARTAVAVDDTDLKSRVAAAYEQWKVERVAAARRAFEDGQRAPKSPPPVAAAALVEASGKPARAPDGTYPLLLARLKTGAPSEITPQNILRWQEAQSATFNGKPAWTVEVRYRTKTMFGDMDVDSLAYVQNGRVQKWLYKGSGEEVP